MRFILRRVFGVLQLAFLFFSHSLGKTTQYQHQQFESNEM